MVRVTISKFLLLCGLCATSCISISMLWLSCGSGDRTGGSSWRASNLSQTQELQKIDCLINQDYVISCRRSTSEVYVPFSFLKRYFEVYGSIRGGRFEWSHSYGKINPPRTAYSSRGPFMFFENYNVEMRERVKAISGVTGVPVSTQWDSEGYFYATQIAQFGLSHYSKNLTEDEPVRKVLEDGDETRLEWRKSKETILARDQSVVNFSGTLEATLNHSLLVLGVSLNLRANSSVTVYVTQADVSRVYKLTYSTTDVLMKAHENSALYGLGAATDRWRRITRDLFVDLQKALQLNALSVSERRKKVRRGDLRVTAISFSGAGSFDDISLSTSDHMAHFYDAADWLIENQEPSTGGWPIPVRRKLGTGFQELSSGWYSAMSQGHAISLLARAYHARGDKKYLKAALDGTKLFRIPSYQGGVAATFAGKYVWYEEYPTQPPSFVLNGFIYSLFGLYDVVEIAPRSETKEIEPLLRNGMVSLKKMLPLYDASSGSFYDLRHFTLGIAPNVARWDYHTTHVNQLLVLATIDKDPILSRTAERWGRYMMGERSPHN